MKLQIYVHTERHLRGRLAIFTDAAVSPGYVHLATVDIDGSAIPDRKTIEKLIQQHEAKIKAARVAELKQQIAELEGAA